METSALIALLMLLVEVGAACLRIVPERRQFFEYESAVLSCEDDDDDDGRTNWRVARNLRQTASNGASWTTSPAPCTIALMFVAESGEYWCEDNERRRGRSVHISITAGAVILQSSVLPVMEGDSVTLRCIQQKAPDTDIADFYKDGAPIGTGYLGRRILSNVSVSDEGIYKCTIQGVGESPESRLDVKERSAASPCDVTLHVAPASAGPRPQENSEPRPRPHPCDLIGTAISVSSVALLLLVVGLLHCRKRRVSAEAKRVQFTNADIRYRDNVQEGERRRVTVMRRSLTTNDRFSFSECLRHKPRNNHRKRRWKAPRWTLQQYF